MRRSQVCQSLVHMVAAAAQAWRERWRAGRFRVFGQAMPQVRNAVAGFGARRRMLNINLRDVDLRDDNQSLVNTGRRYSCIRSPLDRFDAPEDEVGLLRLLAAEALRLFLDCARRFLPAGGVDQFDVRALKRDGSRDVIARRAGDRTDDCRGCSRKSIEQAALARVRLANNRDAERATADRTLVEPAFQIGEMRHAGADSQEHVALVDELNVFLAEIEPGLDIGEEIQQIVAQRMQRLHNAAGELSQRLVQLIVAACLDDREHRFRLREIFLP